VAAQLAASQEGVSSVSECHNKGTGKLISEIFSSFSMFVNITVLGLPYFKPVLLAISVALYRVHSCARRSVRKGFNVQAHFQTTVTTSLTTVT
jgi:hypothetical protein